MCIAREPAVSLTRSIHLFMVLIIMRNMRIKVFIGGPAAAVLLLVLSCASLKRVGINQEPDPEWGYLLVRGQMGMGFKATLELYGQDSLKIPLHSLMTNPLQLIRVEPGVYYLRWVRVSRGDASGSIPVHDLTGFDRDIEFRPGELVYIGDWHVTVSNMLAELNVKNYASRDFEELKERFPLFASFPRRVGFSLPERLDSSGLEDGETAFVQSTSYEPGITVTPFHQAYGTMTFLASLDLLDSLEPEEIDQFRSLLLSTFPENPPTEPTTLAEYALGGYTSEGGPLTVQLIIIPLSSFTPEDEAEREGAMFGVVLLTNLIHDEEGQPTRKTLPPDLDLDFLGPAPLTYEYSFVLFENGSLVALSVYNETADLDLDSWIPIVLTDGLDAIAAADTLVRDADPANDLLIPTVLASDKIEPLGESARAAAALNLLLFTIAQGDFEAARTELESIQQEFSGITETSIRHAIYTQAPVVLQLARSAAAGPEG